MILTIKVNIAESWKSTILYVYNVRNSEEKTKKFDLPQPFLKLRFLVGAVAGVYLVIRESVI